MSADIFWWWFFLCSVAGFNILAWSLSAAALERRQATLSAEDYAQRRLQLLLSAGYVLGWHNAQATHAWKDAHKGWRKLDALPRFWA